MSDERWSGLLAVGIYALMRLVDWLLPKGRHLTWLDRWSRKDDDDGPTPDA
jgi:hypothetical protein